jgi:hypothetical protein
MARRFGGIFYGMFNVVVEWLDEEKTRARFSLPGRQEWSAQHVSDLMRVLAEIRAEMSPPPEQAPIVLEARVEESWQFRS